MDLLLHPSQLSGEVTAVSSKSHAHRILICAALADKPTKIHCHVLSKDIEATIKCLTALGAEISFENGVIAVVPVPVVFDRICSLDCNESGSTLRFLLPVAAALNVTAEFTGKGRLSERPLSPLYEQLIGHGCSLSKQGAFPLLCKGRLTCGTYIIAGNVSSQFISGLLFALPLLDGNSNINITGKTESVSYINMTLEALNEFGIKVKKTPEGFFIKGNQKYRSPSEITIEGDWSNAAFWLASGAVSSSGCITVKGLNKNSLQGDMQITDLLKAFGAKVYEGDDFVTVYRSQLSGININAANIPDLVPILAVVAAAAKGKTKIYGAERLKIKESDRLSTVTKLLTVLGAKVTELPDGLIIEGGSSLHGGKVSSENDHRIAMSAAVASTLCNSDVILTDAQAVNKSYPGFFEVFKELGGNFICREDV